MEKQIKSCRVCLTETEQYFEFSDQLCEIANKVSILESFNICTNLEAYENDDFSQILCRFCTDNLRISFQFILTAEDSDRILRERTSKLENDQIIYQNEDEQQSNNSNVFEELTNPFDSDHQTVETHHEKVLVKKRKQSHLCLICNKVFGTAQRLKTHDLIHSGEKNYACETCPKRFATVFRLRNHLRTHTGEKPFECKECGQRFCYSYTLTCHKRIHTGEKPYECDVCGKKFTQKTILKTHSTIHTGKTVECSLCDKKFSRPSHLILHKREHTGEKPYNCGICDKSYIQKSHLDRHLDTHAGIKFECKFCKKEYSKKSSLKIHMFEHTGNKPHQCTDCLETFARKDRYKAHLRRKHKKI